MSLYRIYHPATNRVVNLYASASDAVNQGTPLSLYSWENNADQKFEMEYHDTSVIFRLERARNMVINRDAKTNAAMVWPFDTSAATLNDSLIDTETESGNMRIKLVKQNLYLTKDANSYMLYWKAKSANDSKQFFKLEQVDPTNQGGGDSGNSTESGYNSNYVYPTVCRQYIKGYSYNHPALDIRDKSSNHNVYAIADGVVAFAQNDSGSWLPGTPEGNQHSGSMASMGNCIAINHNNPFGGHSGNRSGTYARSIYMHMAYHPTVRPGDTIKKGQIIGVIGTTGLSSGKHLHFNVSVGNGTSLKPGSTGWIRTVDLPDFDPTLAFPKYYYNNK